MKAAPWAVSHRFAPNPRSSDPTASGLRRVSGGGGFFFSRRRWMVPTEVPLMSICSIS